MKKIILFLVSIIIFLLLMTKIVLADESFDLAQKIKPYGISFEQLNNYVEIYVNKNQVLSHFKKLQDLGLFNPDITQTQLNEAPILSSTIIGMYFSVVIIPYIYRTTNSDYLFFNLNLITPDSYGKDETQLCVPFNFSRELYNKINWDNFDTPNILKVVPNLIYSPWYLDQIRNENIEK
jgi:hypothetical protein